GRRGRGRSAGGPGRSARAGRWGARARRRRGGREAGRTSREPLYETCRTFATMFVERRTRKRPMASTVLAQIPLDPIARTAPRLAVVATPQIVAAAAPAGADAAAAPVPGAAP